VNRYLLGAICLGIAELAWTAGTIIASHARGYQRGRDEGYLAGFEAGQTRADQWWMDLEYETLKASKEIKDEERWP